MLARRSLRTKLAVVVTVAVLPALALAAWHTVEEQRNADIRKSEAVAATAELQPDVVLLDMSMPRMGGLQAIPKMRRKAPGTSIIGLSSLSAARMAAPSIEIGAP